MLLLHLGAPENISAFAMADAELWLRHCFFMLLQIGLIAFIIVRCARDWQYKLVAACLTVLGSIKYGERILALRHATRAKIIESALPIYKYMHAEPQLGPPGTDLDPENPSYHYIVQGERQWFKKFRAESKKNQNQLSDPASVERAAAEATPRLVTLQDVLSCQKLSDVRHSMVLLCAGFALFKMYKRRLSSLYMYERNEPKTYSLFANKRVFKDEKEIMFVLDAELRFLFDTLYTKTAETAFSKRGIFFRFLSTILLVVSGVFVFSNILSKLHSDQVVEQPRIVTICLLVVALIIEVYQWLMFATSDWTKVWLVCTYIVCNEKLNQRQEQKIVSSRWCCICQCLCINFIKICCFRINYWNGDIGQYSLVDTIRGQCACQHLTIKVVRYIKWENQLQLLPDYVQDEHVVERFKVYVLGKAIVACSKAPLKNEEFPIYWLYQKHSNDEILQRILGVALCADEAGKVAMNVEHFVVIWHVATCVCEVLVVVEPDQRITEQAANTADHQHQTDVEAAITAQADTTDQDHHQEEIHSSSSRSSLNAIHGGLSAAHELTVDRTDQDHRHQADLEATSTTQQADIADQDHLQGEINNSPNAIRNGSPAAHELAAAHRTDEHHQHQEDLEAAITAQQADTVDQDHRHGEIQSNDSRSSTDAVRTSLPAAHRLLPANHGEDVEMSNLLSRYVMYLLVHKAELLQCHADIGRETAADAEKDMSTLTWSRESIMELLRLMSTTDHQGQHTLAAWEIGMKVGEMLQQLSSEARWRLVANVWVDILVCCASCNKPIEHMQQLALGGEFLTHLWVLLGHMGYGAR